MTTYGYSDPWAEPWPDHWERPPQTYEEARELAYQVWADRIVLLGVSPEETARKIVHERGTLGELLGEGLTRVARAYEALHSPMHRTKFRMAAMTAMAEANIAPPLPFVVGWIPGED
jgi:hypothetical protein